MEPSPNGDYSGLKLRIPSRKRTALVTIEDSEPAFGPDLQKTSLKVTIHSDRLKDMITNAPQLQRTPSSEADFFDSINTSELDHIVDMGHGISERPKSDLEKENLSDDEPLSDNDTQSLLVTLKLPSIKQIFDGNGSAPDFTNKETLEAYARRLFVAIDHVLSNSTLPDNEKIKLRKYHSFLASQAHSIKLEKLRPFVNRMVTYFAQLNQVSNNESNDTAKIPVQPVEALEALEPANPDPANLEQPPKIKPEAPKPESTKKEPAKPKKKFTRRKPKLPYQRYHFALPLKERTTFADLEQDDDIIAESYTMSLIDPISGSRFVTPMRSRFCSHLECFDMSSFLALNHLRPFKVGVRRELPLANGAVNIPAIFRDTKRHFIDPKVHNAVSMGFQYRQQYTSNKRMGRYNNKLEYFQCPICKLEFSIQTPGDVYVLGEMVDLLFSLEKSDDMDVEKIEIDHNGKWKPIKEEQDVVTEKKKEEIEVIDLSEESDTEEEEPLVVPKKEKRDIEDDEDGYQQGSDLDTVASSNFEDSWDEEFDEIDRILDAPADPEAANERESTVPPYPDERQPPGPPSQTVSQPPALPLPNTLPHSRTVPPPSSYPGAAQTLPPVHPVSLSLPNGLTYNPPTGLTQPMQSLENWQRMFKKQQEEARRRRQHPQQEPVFFTGTGDQTDPFVID